MNLPINTQDIDPEVIIHKNENNTEIIQCNQRVKDNVYAIGYIKPYFATLDLEKQYEAAADFLKKPYANFLDVFNYKALAQEQPNISFRPFLYLAQQATWIFAINNVDTFRLLPRTMTQLDTLINACSWSQNEAILIGLSEQKSTPNHYDSVVLPVVMVDHIINTATIDAKSNSHNTSEGALSRLKPNIGLSHLERASNYLVTHFKQINVNQKQEVVIETVSAVHFQDVLLQSERKIIEVILSSPDGNRFACNIDVTDAYPFVSSKLAPFAKSS